MVERTWDEIAVYYSGVDIDAFVVMPNHIHGIVVLEGVPIAGVGPTRECVGPTRGGVGPTRGGVGPTRGSAPTLSLPEVVKRFKTLTTTRYVEGVAQRKWPRFKGHVWQRNYYEHVVRDEIDLQRIRQYIEDNPIAWATDPDNPSSSP